MCAKGVPLFHHIHFNSDYLYKANSQHICDRQEVIILDKKEKKYFLLRTKGIFLDEQESFLDLGTLAAEPILL